jgi:hypothetical protein
MDAVAVRLSRILSKQSDIYSANLRDTIRREASGAG